MEAAEVTLFQHVRYKVNARVFKMVFSLFMDDIRWLTTMFVQQRIPVQTGS